MPSRRPPHPWPEAYSTYTETEETREMTDKHRCHHHEELTDLQEVK